MTEQPITASLDPYEWDSEASVAYEAAVEAINGVVGAYTARITQETDKPEAERDDQAVTEWRRLRTECQQARQGLDASNADAIAHTRRKYAELLRELSA